MKILIVEDNTSILEVYSQFLTDSGFEVIKAVDGAEAKSKITQEPWEILLLDIMLPRMDGLSLLKELKANPEFSSRPVIVISNIDDKELQKSCFMAGASKYLVKSEITPGDLLENLQEYVDKT